MRQLLTNISISFLPLLKRLETSSRPFHGFSKMKISCDLKIFSWWCLLFLIVPVHNNKIVKNDKLFIISFRLIAVGWQIKNDLDFRSNLPCYIKFFQEIFSWLHLLGFMLKWFLIRKKFKDVPYLHVNTHHHVTISSISRPYYFKFFKGCLSQILLGPFLNTLIQISHSVFDVGLHADGFVIDKSRFQNIADIVDSR